MTTSERTEQVFSATAATYDAARARLIPGFTAFYAAAIDLLPTGTHRVLDLGAGTGLLAALVRARFPDAYIKMVDNSQPMLDQARARFAQDRESTCLLADYTRDPLGSDFDAVVSALSIHHLPHESKQQLFARILPALKPGGIFINAEQILQPTPEQETAARDQWLADIRSLGASEQQAADSLHRQTEDRCATIDDQLRWLHEAGFQSGRCVYAQGRFAVLAAERRP